MLRSLVARRFVRFWASGGAKFFKMGEYLLRTPINHRTKFDAASFIPAGVILNHTNTQNKQTNKQTKTVNDISTKWSNFRLSWAPDLDLDLGSGHGHCLFSSLIEYYLYTKFHRNRRNFLWTDGHTDTQTDGNLPPIVLGRLPKFGSRPKNEASSKCKVSCQRCVWQWQRSVQTRIQRQCWQRIAVYIQRSGHPVCVALIHRRTTRHASPSPL